MAATKISGTDRVIQLLECCDDQLRKDPTCSAGKSLTTQSEEEVLRAIKRLAVWEENIMVARVALHDMRQDNDETIGSFGARILGQANVCQYNTACPNCSTTIDLQTVSYGMFLPEASLTMRSNSTYWAMRNRK